MHCFVSSRRCVVDQTHKSIQYFTSFCLVVWESFTKAKKYTKKMKIWTTISTAVAVTSFLSIGNTNHVSGFSSIVAPAWNTRRGTTTTIPSTSSSRLAAEGGPPKYDTRMGKVRQVEVAGEGSVLVQIEPNDEADTKLDYEPGHVLALEIEETTGNGEWLRGPYTITRGTDSSFDVLLKVVGNKSKIFANAQPGKPVKFGGRFHVPIVEGIIAAKDGDKSNSDTTSPTKRVVMISTGVGVGPCIGAIEKLLMEKEVTSSFDATIDLFASYRTQEEIVGKDRLDELKSQYPERFNWQPIITSDTGRISSKDDNVKLVVQKDNSGSDGNICSISETHYHLIGNGQMVREWKEGLEKAGVPTERVTIESYFNHRADTSNEAIERIARVVQSAALLKAEAAV